jgi:hypothetical protein
MQMRISILFQFYFKMKIRVSILINNFLLRHISTLFWRSGSLMLLSLLGRPRPSPGISLWCHACPPFFRHSHTGLGLFSGSTWSRFVTWALGWSLHCHPDAPRRRPPLQWTTLGSPLAPVLRPPILRIAFFFSHAPPPLTCTRTGTCARAPAYGRRSAAAAR